MSASASRSPSTSAWTSRDKRSSVGATRRERTTRSTYSRISTVAARNVATARSASPPAEDTVSLSASTASLHAWNRGRSSSGMPSISAMTIIGSGAARSAATSIRSPAVATSTSPVASAWMRDSMAAIARGVNARWTSARSFECRGGSWKMSQSSGCPPGGAAREPNVSCSVSTRRTCS